jgi:hypothetical protein
MKKIFSILFIFLPILIYSQADEIKNIHLHNKNSMVVFSEIDIYIYQAKDSAEVYVKTYKSEKIISVTCFTWTFQIFKSLINFSFYF